MGKGDKKTKKGKIAKGSFGKSRPANKPVVNTAKKPETEKGKSYIKHKNLGKRILLFVREKNEDQYGNTMSCVFI